MTVFQIPSNQLASMRSQAEQTMQDDVTILTVTYGYDEYGNQVPTNVIYQETKGLFARPTEQDYQSIQDTYNEGTRSVIGRTLQVLLQVHV